MKKIIAIMFFCWFGLATSLQAQSVAVVKIKPAPFVIRPACPGPGYVWVNGYWGWNRMYKKNIWINGYWTRIPHHRHYYNRVRVF